MKLLVCRSCQDVIKVLWDWRPCRCGEAQARYIDDRIVEVTGTGIIMGVSNRDLEKSVRAGEGKVGAMIISHLGPSVRKVTLV